MLIPHRTDRPQFGSNVNPQIKVVHIYLRPITPQSGVPRRSRRHYGHTYHVSISIMTPYIELSAVEFPSSSKADTKVQ